MSIEIRRARPEDADALTELSIRSKRSNGYDEAFMAACREELTVTGQSLRAGEYWVAEGDVLCGCACLSADPDGRAGEIHAFFIDPDWQRQGIGRLLWQELLERAHETGLVRLYLDADPAAVPFYEALGFEVTGESPSGSIAGRTLPRMTLALDRTDRGCGATARRLQPGCSAGAARDSRDMRNSTSRIAGMPSSPVMMKK